MMQGEGKQEDIDVNVTEDSETKHQIPTIKIEHCDNDSHHFENVDCMSSPTNSTQSSNQVMSDGFDSEMSSVQRSTSCEPDTSTKENEEDIQETLADIAQNFTSKLDSIRSSFTLSLSRNVASCLGKK